MPSAYEERETARKQGYLLGLRAATVRMQDDEGNPSTCAKALREVTAEALRVASGGALPGAQNGAVKATLAR